MTFYERIMGYMPENIWTVEMCDVLAACLYWNGFPTSWTMSDLWDITKFPASLTKKEQLKEWARRHCVLDMTFEIIDKIKKNQMKGTFLNEDRGPFFVSPQEFYNYTNSKNHVAHDPNKVRQDLCFAPPHIQSAIYGMKKRKNPELASTIAILKKRRIPKCQCGGRAPCCIQKVVRLESILLYREQMKKCAKGVNIKWMATKGRKATPREIFVSQDFQPYWKKLRAFLGKHEEITKYESLIIKNWIPQAIGKRAKRGRPPTKQRKKTNNKNSTET